MRNGCLGSCGSGHPSDLYTETDIQSKMWYSKNTMGEVLGHPHKNLNWKATMGGEWEASNQGMHVSARCFAKRGRLLSMFCVGMNVVDRFRE